MSDVFRIQATPPSPELWAPGRGEANPIDVATFGFWLYMLSDTLVFAALFAAYGVLDHRFNAAGGPTSHEIVHPLAAFWQTLIVLSSTFAYGMAMVGIRARSRLRCVVGLAGSAALGAAFIALENMHLAALVAQGNPPERSGYLSAFFILMAVHNLHLAFGVLWMLVMIVQVSTRGFTTGTVIRLLNLRFYWMFQTSIWVCIFVFIYLRGVA